MKTYFGHKALLAGGLIQTLTVGGIVYFILCHKALLAGGLIQTVKDVF